MKAQKQIMAIMLAASTLVATAQDNNQFSPQSNFRNTII